MTKNCAVILAAGEGTRMKSSSPKVLAKVLFTPMIDWVISAVTGAGINDICVVTGHMSQAVETHLNGRCETVFQAQRLGTGHAVAQAKEFITAHSGENVLVLNGDAPLIDSQTINSALKVHTESRNSATVVSAKVADPSGYGRMVRSDSGVLERIVEQRDASEEEKKIDEVNSGLYWFSCDSLLGALADIEAMGREKKEIYLTDAIEILLNNGEKADAYIAECTDVILGANDRRQLSQLNEIARKKLLDHHMLNGVDIPCTDGVMIAPGCEIGTDTTVLPGTEILAGTKIGCGCTIGPNSRLEGCTVGDFCTVNASQCEYATLGNKVSVGPFSHLRPNTVLADCVHAGNFVEVKNSSVGNNTSISHLSYIGDSDVGEGVNIGCGCATANYDGTKKFRTTIGNKVFVGCHTCMVSPVTLGDGCYTAAGSVITEAVPEGQMAIARSRQVIKRKVRKYNED